MGILNEKQGMAFDKKNKFAMVSIIIFILISQSKCFIYQWNHFFISETFKKSNTI